MYPPENESELSKLGELYVEWGWSTGEGLQWFTVHNGQTTPQVEITSFEKHGLQECRLSIDRDENVVLSCRTRRLNYLVMIALARQFPIL